MLKEESGTETVNILRCLELHIGNLFFFIIFYVCLL